MATRRNRIRLAATMGAAAIAVVWGGAVLPSRASDTNAVSVPIGLIERVVDGLDGSLRRPTVPQPAPEPAPVAVADDGPQGLEDLGVLARDDPRSPGDPGYLGAVRKSPTHRTR